MFSYPALKAVRGDRHRWVYTPKARTAQMIVAAATDEVAGAYRLLDDEASLHSAIFDQVAEKGGGAEAELQLLAGVGEAATVALLGETDGAAAAAYAALAAGCDIRLSPMPFLAVTQSQLLSSLGISKLESLQTDHFALLRYTKVAV